MEKHKFKTIGIIGGMGPAATADLMNKIIDMTEAAKDQDHIPMFVDSNTCIPDRTLAILEGGEDPVPQMLRSAKRLEQAGADFLIVPCNTAHFFVPQLQKEVGIPFLNMPQETGKLLQQKGIKRAAVLATNGTCQSGLYEKVLTEAGIETLYPSPEQQKLVMSLIYDYIKKGITDPNKLPREGVVAMIKDLHARGAQALLLACTELPLAFSILDLYDDTCVDPTSVLACAAIQKAGATVRKK